MKKTISIVALTLASVVAMAHQTKPVSTKINSLVPIDTLKKPAKTDSIKVSVDDFKAVMQVLSNIVNNSSDISTKQANAKGGPNEIITTLYFKYFPKEKLKQ
jgi:hypothetical protein